ncbi:phosphoribosylanthranilate isomerase [Ruminococcus sp.]|uniref:phosphoribosylanthranilate isomerase n=1 Tax=Ruminococcus sp. TaxID=41978 RepID=UPI002E785556|nr:phosphoribosylanthranilate isomerase [Ruminococcus sp.]MEE1264205.1 phosphoribosylanthranilate isomerase [Ruminococcus sp.]
MTKIKLCGLSRIEDIEAANNLKPDFIGFVFAAKSKRRVSHLKAAELKSKLNPETKAVGVFLDDDLDTVGALMNLGIVDLVQLHGSEDEEYISKLRAITDKPIIKAFIINNEDDVKRAEASSADYILLDGGKGEGRSFNWKLLESIKRPYFLAGGLNADNAEAAVADLHPFAVDVSTGIETGGVKDKEKMAAFVTAVRKGETK